MNEIIQATATFNELGKVRVDYVQLMNEEKAKHIYKVAGSKFKREEKFAGMPALVFDCYIQDENELRLITVKLYKDSMQWVLVE